MRFSLLVAAVVSTFALVQPASAQTSNAAVASAPGKVGIAQTAEVSATITAIDKATRGITLKGPKVEGSSMPARRRDMGGALASCSIPSCLLAEANCDGRLTSGNSRCVGVHTTVPAASRLESQAIRCLELP